MAGEVKIVTSWRFWVAVAVGVIGAAVWYVAQEGRHRRTEGEILKQAIHEMQWIGFRRFGVPARALRGPYLIETNQDNFGEAVYVVIWSNAYPCARFRLIASMHPWETTWGAEGKVPDRGCACGLHERTPPRR